MKSKAILSSILRWTTFPMRSKATIGEWSAFLVLMLMVSFLWGTVVSEIE